jgi:hypothetical protein
VCKVVAFTSAFILRLRVVMQAWGVRALCWVMGSQNYLYIHDELLGCCLGTGTIWVKRPKRYTVVRHGQKENNCAGVLCLDKFKISMCDTGRCQIY